MTRSEDKPAGVETGGAAVLLKSTTTNIEVHLCNLAK